jgi:hypothetical protein
VRQHRPSSPLRKPQRLDFPENRVSMLFDARQVVELVDRREGIQPVRLMPSSSRFRWPDAPSRSCREILIASLMPPLFAGWKPQRYAISLMWRRWSG